MASQAALRKTPESARGREVPRRTIQPPNQPRGPRHRHGGQPEQPHGATVHAGEAQRAQHGGADQRAGDLRERDGHVVQALHAGDAGAQLGELGVDERKRHPHGHGPGGAHKANKGQGGVRGTQEEGEQEGGGGEDLGEEPDARQGDFGTRAGVDEGQDEGRREGAKGEEEGCVERVGFRLRLYGLGGQPALCGLDRRDFQHC